ncbi:MAG: hypothetical protein HZA81_01075, partial [Candidatus Taylorbacteria bacterium]|nr:hypothetical protein [Candidatus Taylorbacteria bacterium]
MRNKATLTAKIITKATTLLVVVAIFVTNLPLDILGRGIERLINEANVVDIAWKASRDPNVVDSFPSLRGLAKQLRTRGALAAAQGDGKIFYSIAANTTPRTRDYVATTNSFNSAASTVAGGTALQSSIKASPTKDEYIAGYVNSAGTLQVMCYDGASWTNEWSVSVGGTGTTRRFDIAYEKTSGDVMVVYGTNAATTNELAYRTKAGSSACGSANWSGATNYDAVRTSGIVHWVRAEGSPASGSNTIAVAWADANADLSAMEWTGASFAVAEPAAALETSLEFVTAAQDVQSFDIAFESTSGELMVAWGLTQATSCTAGTAIATTNCIRYATYTNAWSSVAAIPTVADPATHLDMSGNPNTNEIVLASVDNSQADVSAAYWSGSAWTGQANIDITAQAATAGTKFVATGWLIAGATTRSVITYYDSATTNVGWIVGNAGSFAAQTDFAPTPVFGAQRQYAIDMDPFNKDRLIFTVGDTNSDVFAKRLIMTSTPGFTWSNADGGAALEANTGSNIYRTADFEYARYIPVTTTLATGSDPASTTVAPESGIVDAGQFTFQASSGTDSITGLNVTLAGAGTPYDGVSEVRITSSDGLTTYFTAIANPSSNSLSFSGGTPIPVTSSVATFKIRVTPKTHANMAAPSGASYALSPLVSNWTGTNAHGGSDTNANTLTIDNLSPANVTSATATAGDTQVSLSWTNPVDGDLSQIVILRRATSAV